jgi:hypothetical protein
MSTVMSGGRKATMTTAARRLLALAGLIAAYALLGAATAGAASTGIVCTNGPNFNLETAAGHVDTPDSNVIYTWSYIPAGGAFQTPGPVLCVNQGDVVTIHLHNTFAVATSIVFPGQEGVSPAAAPGKLGAEVPPGGDVTYTFTASQPGTYLYESGTNAAVQVDMGLYGALVVRPSGHADYAYGDARTQFEPAREYLMLINEIDPALHKAIETGTPTFDTLDFWPRYWTINGREFPDTLDPNKVSYLPAQPYGALVKVKPYDAVANPYPALVRMLNAGEQNHPFHPHGNHLKLIAQDGRLISTPAGGDASTEHFADTIASGQTLDLLLSWKDPDGFSTTNPVPLTLPSYKNLAFKDATTWYSGSPYLGQKGTLPTGTVSFNICGELYFPWHSHALNEFVNYDVPFGGLATLMRVDPLIGCTAFPASTKISTGVVSGTGTYANLVADDTAYYSVSSAVNTTVRTAMTAVQTTAPVASSVGFPTTAPFTIQIDSEQMTVTSGAGTATWTVTRHVNATLAAPHAVGAPVTLVTAGPSATDWYAGFTGIAEGGTNLKITYKGKNSVSCNQSLYLWKWALAGSWVQVSAPAAVGTTDVTVTVPTIADPTQYIGTGTYRGQLRLRVLCNGPTTSWVSSGNLIKLVYDAP